MFLFKQNHSNRIIAILFLAMACGKMYSQTCDWLNVESGWGTQNTYDLTTDKINDVIVIGAYDSNLNVGSYSFFSSGPTGFIIKYNSDGKLKWAITSVSSNCYFLKVQTDAYRNIYVHGYISGFVDFGNGVTYTSSSTTNAILVKYDSSGVAQWVRGASGSFGTLGLSSQLSIDKNNNIIIGFVFTGNVDFVGSSITITSNGSNDIGIAKYTPQGELIRAKNIGSTKSDLVSDIGIDDNNNIYLLGNSWGTFVYASQLLRDTGDIILKMDSAFIPLKGKKTYGNTYDFNSYSGIAVLGNGSFAVSSQFFDSVNYGNGVYLVTNHSYTGPNYYNSTPSIVFYDADFKAQWAQKGEIIAGESRALSKEVFESNDYIYFGGQLGYGSIKFGNSTLNFIAGRGHFQLYFVKMDKHGNFLWAFTDGAVNKSSVLSGLTADNIGDLLATGPFTSSVKIFNQSKTTNYPPFYDIYTAKITDYTITRGYVKSGPYCAGDTIEIPYTKKGTYNTDNYFVAELSDSSGNFEVNYRELGKIKDTSSGVIKGLLPLFNVATNNKYRIRIMSTSPVVQSFYKIDTLRLLVYSKDTANAGADTLICRGQNIRLSTTGGSKWHWSPNTFMYNAMDTANKQPLIKPDSTTEYRIIISDSSGCGEIDTDYIKVYVRPEISAKIVGDSNICRGVGQVLKASVTGGRPDTYWYNWKIKGNPIVFSKADTLFVRPNDSAIYQLVVGDSCNVRNDTTELKINVDTKLKTTVTPDTVVCKGDSIVLEINGWSCIPQFYKYQWKIAGQPGVLSNQRLITVVPDTSTIYQVILSDTTTALADTELIIVTVRQPLRITANTDTTICFGQTAELRATTSGGDVANHNVVWSEVSGQWSVVGKTTMVSPIKTTTYRAVLTDGCTVLGDSAEITITVRPPLKISVNTDTTICVGESAQIRASYSGGNTPSHSLLWTADSGPWTNTNPNVTVNPTQTTVYKALLSDGCTSPNDSAQITVTVRPPLKVTVNKDTTICVGQSAELRATGLGGNAPSLSILWTEVGGPWTQNSPQTKVSPQGTTTYKALLSDNCTTPNDSAQITVTVRPPLSIVASAKDSICSNQILILNATVSGGNVASHSILWTSDHGLLTTAPTPTDTPKVTTTYIVRLRDNCSPDVFDTLKVIVLPVPKADFEALPFEGCPPLSVTFTDVSTGNDTLLNTWKIQSNEVSGVKNYSHEFVKPGKYGIGLIASNALGCNDYIYKPNIVIVFEKPQAQFIAKPDIKEIESPVFLYNQSRRANFYTWDMGDGNQFTQENTFDTLYSYTDTGSMVIKLIAKNEKNCLDTQTQIIRIHDKMNCVIPSAFTPNGDYLNNTFSPVCVGVANYHITIFNRWGETVMDCDNCTWDGTYNGYAVPPGVYLYKLKLKAHSNKEGTSFGTVQVVR